MNRCVLRWTLLLGLAGLLAGCATNRVNWNSRIGNYTLDQAMVELGPPDKTAKLSNGGTVAEWLTHRGYSYIYSPFVYGMYPYSFYPYTYERFNAPDYFLRLNFDAEQKLLGWKKFSR